LFAASSKGPLARIPAATARSSLNLGLRLAASQALERNAEGIQRHPCRLRYVATVWFSFCRAEALRDTAGERLAAVQTQRNHAFPADFPETLHDAPYVPGDGEVNEAWSQRLSVAARELLFTLAALAGDMVIEANFHPHSELEADRLRGLGDRVVEVHCACPAEVAVARYNARPRNEVHW
jgi:hypothetical protein